MPYIPSSGRRNGTERRNERRSGVLSSLKGGPGIRYSPPALKITPRMSQPTASESNLIPNLRTTAHSPPPVPQPAASGRRPPSGLGVAFGSRGRGLRETLESSRRRSRSKRSRSNSPLLATNTMTSNDGGSVARAPIIERNYNDNVSLRGARSKAPITTQGDTEVPSERIKRICVSYTISEDLSGDRGSKILSRISEKKRDSVEVRLRKRDVSGITGV
jgi:hypothetical protein